MPAVTPCQLSPRTLFEEVLDGSPVPTFVIDAGHRVTHWNHACELVLGIAAADIVGTRDQWRPFYPSERPVMADLVVSGKINTLIDTYYSGKYRRSEIVTGSYEAEDFFPQLGENGTWLYFTAAPLVDEHGALIGAVETLQDITERKRLEQSQNAAEEQIRAVLERQQQIFDNAHAGIILLRDRQIITCNQRTAELFGYADAAEMTGLSTRTFYPDEAQWEADGHTLYQRLQEQGHSDDDVLYCRRNGATFWCHRTGRPLNPQAPLEGSIWVFSDITEKRLQEEQLRLSSTVFDNSSEALMITGRDNRIISVNQAFIDITGFAAAEVVGHDPGEFRSGRHDEAFYADMWATLESTGRWQGEIWDRRKNGEIYPKWLTIATVKDDLGVVANYVAAFSDITERKAAEFRIQFLAHHDALTALPNRILLRDRFDHAVDVAKRSHQQLAVMFLDLDHFKRINDTHGHRIGDELLIGVAHRVKGLLREADTLSRLGGDEFIILIEGQDSYAQMSQVAQKILSALDTPFDIQGQSFSTSFSIGIAVYPSDGHEFDALLQRADTAMYHAKNSGRNTYSFFDESMNRNVARRLALHSRMRRALYQDEFNLAFQPQFDLRTHRLTGVEALLRWPQTDGTTVSPADFIPVAEENGLIIPLGQWVLHDACRQARLWQDRGMPLQVAVNVSGVQVYRSDLPAAVAKALADTGIRPELLEVEFTESTLMEDTDTFKDVIVALKAQGVSVAIDDFGTGYSSLSYLKRFRVDKLKIDQSFVADLPHSDDDQAIVQAIIGLARSLRLSTIAEGVETHSQMDFLRSYGCTTAQGFLLGRPGGAAAIETLTARCA